MNWRVKAAVQGAISRLPLGSREANWLLQRYVTRTALPTATSVRAKWDQTARLVDMAGTHSSAVTGGSFMALEVGTGWSPVAPLALRAHGATAVTTVDLESLLRRPIVLRTIALVAEGLRSGALSSSIDSDELASQLLASVSAPDPAVILESCGVEVVVGDVASLIGTHPGVDLAITNNTLEHVPPAELITLLGSLGQLASARGVGAHFIDLRDHYAGFDPSIGPYNFLSFSDSRWNRYNNRLQYQSRLRASDYRRCFEQAGLELVEVIAESGDADSIDGMVLAPQFADRPIDDLLVHSMWVVVRRGEQSGGRPTAQ